MEMETSIAMNIDDYSLYIDKLLEDGSWFKYNPGERISLFVDKSSSVVPNVIDKRGVLKLRKCRKRFNKK